tara:strand:+ start:4926 stop:6722 length:1797 start_codon:yes stop_codon:yes gene_type:complete
MALFLVAAILRLWPIDHGFPDNHVPDATVHKTALRMAESRDLIPVIEGGYPNLLPYTLLPIYAAHYAKGRVTGEWAGSGEYAMAMKRDPWRANRIARVVLALLASLAPIFVVLGLRASGIGRGAWVGGVMLATCLLHLHLSTQERPWAPMITGFALTAWAAAVHARSGGGRSLILAGVAAALTASTHQAGMLAPVLVALAWFASPLGWKARDLRHRLRMGFSSALSFLVLALSIGYPAYVRHGKPPEAANLGSEYTQGVNSVMIGGQSMTFEIDLDAFQHLTTALFGYDPILVVLGLLGVFAGLRRRATLPVVLFGLFWAVVFLTNPKDHVRYLLPLELVLCWTAGIAVDRYFEGGVRWKIAWAMVLVTFVPALRLGYVLRQEDTRSIARWTLPMMPIRGTVAIDVRGPEPLMNVTALERLANERGELTLGEAQRYADLVASDEKPLAGTDMDWFPISLWYEFNPRYGSSWPRPRTTERWGDAADDPNVVLSSLGVQVAILTDATPGDGIAPALVNEVAPSQVPGPDLIPYHAGGPRTRLKPLRSFGVVQSFLPDEDGTAARAQLPLEMDFAWIDLWSVDRPGPAILVHSLIPFDDAD